MSSGKFLIFIMLSSAIMMTAALLQNAGEPNKPDNQELQENAGLDDDGLDDVSEDDGAGNGAPQTDLDPSGNTDEPANDSDDSESTDPKSDSTTERGSPTEPDQQSNPTSSPDQDNESDQDNELAQEPETDSQTKPDQDVETDPNSATDSDPGTDVVAEADPSDILVTIGSLAADGSDRFLITLNQKGGTIRRVELNFRNEDGRYRYRDAVWKGGYLGCLDCIDVLGECQVRVVGDGTPAELAGIKPGDIIVSLNGEPVASAEEFETILKDPKKSKPNTSMEVVVKRNGANQTFTVALTEKPIEIIRPESGIVDPDFDYPESFVMSLVQPAGPEKAWLDLDNNMRDGLWDVAVLSSSEIAFKYELPESNLKSAGLTGPITVFKRFKIPELPPEQIYNLDSRTFHFTLDLEVINGSDQPLPLAFELDGPTGITAEAWWYENKIHGRQTAIGYIAGARDIVGKTGINSYVFFGCPEIVKAALKLSPKISFVCDPMEEDERNRELYFVGVDSHYFNVSMLPQTVDHAPYIVNSVSAYPNNRNDVLPVIPKNARLQKIVDMTFQMTAPLEVAPQQSFSQTFDIFCGPKEKILLPHYELGNVRTFGWFSWCSKILLYVLGFFYTVTFSFSYGLAIVMLTILVRCLMIPMSRKAALNAQMMQHLAPQTKAIAEKYKDDMEKRTAAQRELYKKYKFNPLSGCLMMFVQLPIFYGLYKGLNVDIALRDQPLIPGMSWCSNLAAPDQLLYWKDWMPGALANETGWLGPYLNILPLITMVLFIAQQKLFTPPPTDDQQKMMQKVMTFMMLFMGIMFFKVPSGLCIYFITSSLWGIIERKMLPKPVLDTDKIDSTGSKGPSRAQAREGKKRAKANEAETSKKTIEAQERKQRNADRKKRLKKRDQD